MYGFWLCVVLVLVWSWTLQKSSLDILTPNTHNDWFWNVFLNVYKYDRIYTYDGLHTHDMKSGDHSYVWPTTLQNRDKHHRNDKKDGRI